MDSLLRKDYYYIGKCTECGGKKKKIVMISNGPIQGHCKECVSKALRIKK